MTRMTIPDLNELAERVMYDEATASKFWSKVERLGPDDCWLWTGPKCEGYGRVSLNGKKLVASHVSWEIDNGIPFPSGKLGCHKCDNPPCVNPSHIFPGSAKENSHDARRRRRAMDNREAIARMIERLRSTRSHCNFGSDLCAKDAHEAADLLASLSRTEETTVAGGEVERLREALTQAASDFHLIALHDSFRAAWRDAKDGRDRVLAALSPPVQGSKA